MVLACLGCSGDNSFDIDHVEFGEPAIGIPLINSTFLISDFGTNPNENTSILVDHQGRLTIRYEGDVLRQEKNDIFFNLPYIGPDFPLIGNHSTISLPLPGILIKKAIFQETAATFKFVNPTEDVLTIHVTIPEFSKDGQVFSTIFTIPAGSDTYVSDKVPIAGWLIETETSTFSVNYIATTAEGEEISLDSAAFTVDVLGFSYGEGNFGLREYNLTEEIIDVNIFERWVSGGLSFDQPTIHFDIENSFGFPVKADFKKLELVTIEGDTFNLTGPPIQDGIDFNFPSVGMTGLDKVNTEFTFDSSNSNIGELFNQKVASITYDVDALVNPDNSPDVVGFFDNDSYFNVAVSLDLPMSLKANNLIIADTISIDTIPFETIGREGLLQLRVTNALPMDLSMNMEFLGDDNQVLFTLIDDADWITARSSPDPDLFLADLDEQSFEITIPESNMHKLESTDQVVIKAKMTTIEQFGDDYIWLSEHQGLDVHLSLIVD